MTQSTFKITILLFVNILFFSCNKKTKPIVSPSPSYDVVEEVKIERSEEKPIQPIPETPPKPYLLISLQKLGCHGKCPDFEFSMVSNGEATFHGKKHTKRLGQYAAQANAGILLNIKSKIEEANFFQFEKMYPANGNFIKELPDTYILVNYNKQQLIIRNNHDAPKSLLDFQKFVEELIEQLQWEKIN